MLSPVILLSHVDCGSQDSLSNCAGKASGATWSAWSLNARNLVARELRSVLSASLGSRMVSCMFLIVVDVLKSASSLDLCKCVRVWV